MSPMFIAITSDPEPHPLALGRTPAEARTRAHAYLRAACELEVLEEDRVHNEDDVAHQVLRVDKAGLMLLLLPGFVGWGRVREELAAFEGLGELADSLDEVGAVSAGDAVAVEHFVAEHAERAAGHVAP